MNPQGCWEMIARYFMWTFAHDFKRPLVWERVMKWILRWFVYVQVQMCFHILMEQQEHIHLVGVYRIVNSFICVTCHLRFPVKFLVPHHQIIFMNSVCVCVCKPLSVRLNCFIGFLPSAMARSQLCLLVSFCTYGALEWNYLHEN